MPLLGAVNDRSVALALVIPVGGSCRRQDSRNGDKLVVPRYALRSVLDSTNTRRAQLRPQWLDGMSDVLADFLRRLRETHPFATAKIRPDSTPTADYRPSLRSPWSAAIAFLRQDRPLLAWPLVLDDNHS